MDFRNRTRLYSNQLPLPSKENPLKPITYPKGKTIKNPSEYNRNEKLRILLCKNPSEHNRNEKLRNLLCKNPSVNIETAFIKHVNKHWFSIVMKTHFQRAKQHLKNPRIRVEFALIIPRRFFIMIQPTCLKCITLIHCK